MRRASRCSARWTPIRCSHELHLRHRHVVGGRHLDVDRPGCRLASRRLGPRFGHPESPRAPALPGEDGAGEEVEQARDQGGMAGREEADPARKREHPLSDGDGGEDVPDEVLGGVLHPAGVAGGADVGLAGEGHEPLETAVRTANSREAAGEDAAVEVGAQLALDEGRQAGSGTSRSAPPYPALAAAMGWTGVVRVAFTIRTDGTVTDLRVVKTSGRKVLDECALEDVRASAPFPPPAGGAAGRGADPVRPHLKRRSPVLARRSAPAGNALLRAIARLGRTRRCLRGIGRRIDGVVRRHERDGAGGEDLLADGGVIGGIARVVVRQVRSRAERDGATPDRVGLRVRGVVVSDARAAGRRVRAPRSEGDRISVRGPAQAASRASGTARDERGGHAVIHVVAAGPVSGPAPRARIACKIVEPGWPPSTMPTMRRPSTTGSCETSFAFIRFSATRSGSPGPTVTTARSAKGTSSSTGRSLPPAHPERRSREEGP